MKGINICLILIISTLLYTSNAKYYSIFKNSNGYYIEEGRSPEAIAFADYDQDMNTKGWNKLYLTAISKNGVSDQDLAYAAGYLEGSVDPESIWNTLLINLEPYTNNTIPSKMSAWLQTNYEWTNQMVAKNLNDPYWVQVGLLLNQLKGILDGYNSHVPISKKMSIHQLFFVNCAGDRDTLNGFLNDVFNPQQNLMDIHDYRKYIGESHCSALIKLPSTRDDLFTAHTTWDTFISMLRTYKIYEFHYANSPSSKISFSSYPGILSSIDDFYVTDKGLSVIETTNEFMNKSLFSLVVPQNVVSWLRVMVANQATSDGRSWIDVFSKYNSGTYNNQWMITDFKRFQPKQQKLQAGTFWIAEQIPGYIESADLTDVLDTQGYWPSYNIPYFPYIFNISGFPEYVQKYGEWFSHSGSPRAKIFKREQAKIESFDAFKWVMRFNDWQVDPFSCGNAGNGISSRFDLVTGTNYTNPYLDKAPFGGIDSKATSYNQYQEGMTVHAQSGPTYNQQTAFDWSAWPNVVHPGTPNLYNFAWHKYGVPQK